MREISSLAVKMFAALVLRAMARELAEKGIERVSPRDRGVASRLGVEPDSPELAAAERYLVLEDYSGPLPPTTRTAPSSSRSLAGRIWGTSSRRRYCAGDPFGKGCLGSREGAATQLSTTNYNT